MNEPERPLLPMACVLCGVWRVPSGIVGSFSGERPVKSTGSHGLVSASVGIHCG